MKGKKQILIDKCKRHPNETKLKTGSYCFLAILAFQEAKAKQEGNNYQRYVLILANVFNVNSPFVFTVYKLPTCACVSRCMGILSTQKWGFN
jgi:hypothetical protein